MRCVNQSGVHGTTHRRERGVVAIFVALTFVVSVAFAGHALHPAQLYVAKSEQSDGRRACASAEARSVTKVPWLDAPEAAGMAGRSHQRVPLQGGDGAVSTDGDITFSMRYADPYRPTNRSRRPMCRAPASYAVPSSVPVSAMDSCRWSFSKRVAGESPSSVGRIKPPCV